MSEQKNQSVYKFTLSSKKVVYFREPKISDTEHATKLAGIVAGPNNQALLGHAFQKELIKTLLIQINDSKPTLAEKANMDGLFTFKEYTELNKALKMLIGEEDEGKPLESPEIVTL